MRRLGISGAAKFATIGVFTLILCASKVALPQSPSTLTVTVRDHAGRACPAATIILQNESDKHELTGKTDSTGVYNFSGLAAGKYKLRGQSGSEDAFAEVHVGQAAHADVTLQLTGPPATQQQPEFFDEPNFSVAGVTDTNNLGGHGSTTSLETTEALNKGVANLTNRDMPRGAPGDRAQAIQSARRQAEQAPTSLAANYEIGRLLVQDGKPGEALPYLNRARTIDPHDYNATYQLALAYADSGGYQNACKTAFELVKDHNTADSHHLLAELTERAGDPLTAVREYQKAAELEASERNLFDWATELLVHRAIPPAIEVFTRGTQKFPRSARMLTGLGAAQFAGGSKDAAVQTLCAASDLDPANTVPYLLLGKVIEAGAPVSQRVATTMERFARLQPHNGEALYLHALALSRITDKPSSSSSIEALLKKAVVADPKLARAHLELGKLYAGQKLYEKAISSFQNATNADPNLAEPHYRLSLVYSALNDKPRADREMSAYKRLSKEAAEALDRERHDVQQFVYTLKSSNEMPK
jgi:tetratricopeptide (TPR) repeat protein